MSLNTHLTFAQSLGYLNYDWNITEDKLICLIFLLKITSCACFEESGLKFFFHCKAHLLVLFSIQLFGAKFTLWAMENKEVLSTNDFGLKVKPSDKSLNLDQKD